MRIYSYFGDNRKMKAMRFVVVNPAMRFWPLLIALCLVFSWSAAAGSQSVPPQKAYLILVEGRVNSKLSRQVRDGLEKAKSLGAKVAILKINTFGGNLGAAVEIRDALLDSPLRTIALINKRAISAGALVALATHEIIMVPGATIGAAAPVEGTGRGAKPAGEKAISYFRKEMKATAESRNHPLALAEAMVDLDVIVSGVVEKGKLLTLTTQEAVELKLAKEQIAGLGDLIRIRHLELVSEKPAETRSLVERWRVKDWFVQFRAWHVWFIAGLLLGVAEILIPGFFILWFGVGAFLAALLAWLSLPWAVQFGAFLASSFLLLLSSRTIFRSFLFKSQEDISTNVDALTGRIGVVLKAIEGDLKPGLVQLGGEKWSAVCEGEKKIMKGARVKVLGVTGNKVRVEMTS
jgi:membrane-bound ClpP family serine protease